MAMSPDRREMVVQFGKCHRSSDRPKSPHATQDTISSEAEDRKLIADMVTSSVAMRNILGIGLLPGRRLLVVLDEWFPIPLFENVRTPPSKCCHPEDYWVFDNVQSAEDEDNLEGRVFHLNGAVKLSSKWPALYQILSSKFRVKQARFFFVSDSSGAPWLLLYSYYYDDVGQPMYAMALAQSGGGNSVTPVEPGWWAVPGAPYGPFFQYQAPVSTSGAYFYTMNSVQNTVVRQLLSRADKYEVQDGDLPTSGVQDVASYHVCINAKQTFAKVCPWDAHGYYHSNCPVGTAEGISAPYMTAFEDTSGYYFFDHWNNYTWRMDRQTFNGSLGPFTYLNKTNLVDLFVYGKAKEKPAPKPKPKPNHHGPTPRRRRRKHFGSTTEGGNESTGGLTGNGTGRAFNARKTKLKIIFIAIAILVLIIGGIVIYLFFCRKENADDEGSETSQGKDGKSSKKSSKKAEKEEVGGELAGVSGAAPPDQKSKFMSRSGKGASSAKGSSKASKQHGGKSSKKSGNSRRASGKSSAKSSKFASSKKKASGKSSKQSGKSSRKGSSKRAGSSKKSSKALSANATKFGKSSRGKPVKRKSTSKKGK